MICNFCKQDKLTEEFYARGKTCKICVCTKQRIRNQENKLKSTIGQKVCKICSINKDNHDYRINRAICKECEKTQCREYRRNTTKSQEWRSQNIDRMKYLQARWYQNNKPKINKQRSQRYQNDPCYRVWANQKARLYHTINKVKRTDKYLDKDIKDVCKWLEYCMIGDMTWNNHGTIWHIDHVIPIATFDLSNNNDIERCFNWKNLMPLLKEDNLRKNNQILKLQVQQQIQNLKSYSQTSDILEYVDFLLQYTS